MIKQNVYQNRKTGQKVKTSQKLDKKDYKLVKQWRTTGIDSNKISKK